MGYAMKRRPKDLYFDPIKKAPAFTLWPELLISLDAFNYVRPPLKGFAVSNLCVLALHPKARHTSHLFYRNIQRLRSETATACE